MEDKWTVEITLVNGGKQKIQCFNREEAEEIKRYWFKHNREQIKYLHVVAGDTIGNVPDKAKLEIRKTMILGMFRLGLR